MVRRRCNWTRTGGNALLFSHGAKNCTVADSEFFSTGDSAVVACVLLTDLNWHVVKCMYHVHAMFCIVMQCSVTNLSGTAKWIG